MTKITEDMIDALLVDELAKNKLKEADRILSSKSESLRQCSSAFLVTAGAGCGFSSYGKVYSSIVDSSRALKVKGTSTFLELVFPKDNEKEERLFFASPRRAASVRNRFYGTMLISFREFSGQDLMKSESLERLLEFISVNKGNIYFMFHIMPEFATSKQLLSRLRSVINVTEVFLDTPNIECSYTYAISELEEQGYIIGEKGKSLLKKEIIPWLVEGKSFIGYKSLNVFIERLCFEANMESENEELRIKEITLNRLISEIKQEEELSKYENPRIGFGM